MLRLVPSLPRARSHWLYRVCTQMISIIPSSVGEQRPSWPLPTDLQQYITITTRNISSSPLSIVLSVLFTPASSSGCGAPVLWPNCSLV